jgi:tetratricopeptide (TPR) repeat protein
MPFPYVFTFYSYKGGVGRSLAVMNVAYTLAGRGRHVLVVDMDLEAPGLSGFLHRTNEVDLPDGAHPKDVLTILGEAVRAVRSGGVTKDLAAGLPPVSYYVRRVPEEKLAPLRPKLGTLGRLDILGADMDRDYLSRLAQLNLKDLSQEGLIQLSSLLNLYFKAQRFPHRPLGLEDFEPPMDTPYDYVLVDSRTGISEIGGLCVGPLADRLVVITGLNDQNVQGTLSFLRETGIQPRVNDDKWDEADPGPVGAGENASLGPKPTILVASPVPAGEVTLKRERLSELERLLGIQPVSLAYHPLMALMEKIFVRDYREEELAAQYERLATKVMAQVADDPQSLAALSQQFFNEKKEPLAAITAALRMASHSAEVGMVLLTQLFQIVPKLGKSSPPFAQLRPLCAVLTQNAAIRAEALSNWGLALADEAKRADRNSDLFREEAIRKYSESYRLKPDSKVLSNWGNVLIDQAKAEDGEVAEQLFEEADLKFAEALRLEPDSPEAHNNWGTALGVRIGAKAGPDSDQHFEEANRHFAEAVRLKPDFPVAFSNWGLLLSERAKKQRGLKRIQLFEEAGRKYADAIRLIPDDRALLFSWRRTLVERAGTKGGPEADGLLDEARRKYGEAIRLTPNLTAGSSEILIDWGNAVADHAKAKAGQVADLLFEEAYRNFAMALKLKPESIEARNNWAMALADQAKTKMGLEAERLLEEAKRELSVALSTNPKYPEVLNNLGIVFMEQAKAKVGLESARLLEEAELKFAETLRMKPDYPAAIYNSACALVFRAKAKQQEEESDRLFEGAGRKFAEVLILNPEYTIALNDWGVVLMEQARNRKGRDAELLFEQAAAKFAEALRLNPENCGLLINWSAALIHQAALTGGVVEAHNLLEQAREKSLQAEKIRKGSGAYNLACIEARLERTREAILWLQTAVSAGANPITQSSLAAEKDFDAIRDRPEFVAFVNSLPE